MGVSQNTRPIGHPKKIQILAERAKENQYQGINQYSLPQNSAEQAIETREELANAAGISHDTIVTGYA
jgi:hypothetical protein